MAWRLGSLRPDKTLDAIRIIEDLRMMMRYEQTVAKDLGGINRGGGDVAPRLWWENVISSLAISIPRLVAAPPLSHFEAR